MTEEKKSNHRVNIVRLGEPRVHTNADSLELYDIGGYQVVTNKETGFKEGDLAVYIQPDSVVPQTEPFGFLWKEFVDEQGNSPERKRRITVRRFRKEWSEGLLMPIADFSPAILVRSEGFLGNFAGTFFVQEGDDVSDILGITHWEGGDSSEGEGEDKQPKRRRPRSLKGWFYFIMTRVLRTLHIRSKYVQQQLNEELGFHVDGYDVDALKNYKHALQVGEQVIITEKVHGSQGRFIFKEGRMYVGSRNFWKAPESTCVWRKALAQNPWIEAFCRANEGSTLYGEVFPTQKGYRYGCSEGEVKFLAFDIKDAEGNFFPKMFTLSMGAMYCVPVLYEGEWQTTLLDKYVDGQSTVSGAQHAREGIVVTAADPTRHERGLGRVQLKVVSNSFLEKDNK
jgi:hypothetical protein